jgi:hypothetical protein
LATLKKGTLLAEGEVLQKAARIRARAEQAGEDPGCDTNVVLYSARPGGIQHVCGVDRNREADFRASVNAHNWA